MCSIGDSNTTGCVHSILLVTQNGICNAILIVY
jgi:hypothetical protein